MKDFKNLDPKDNFYQTSLFFPMPVVMIGTLTERGKTTLGPYSLIAPFWVAGKDCYTFMLVCRSSSNTAQNIIRTGKCTVNFIPDDRKYFKQAVKMGWPGDKPEEKMKDCIFTLEDGLMKEEHPEGTYPQIVAESFQAVECTWLKELDGADDALPLEEGKDHYERESYHNFNGITSPYGAHFVLRIDKILMKPKYWNTIVNGVTASGFPKVPTDFGYRDSKNFWCSGFRKPHGELLPQRQTTVSSVRYAAERIQTEVKFTYDALEKLVKVPRIFLPTALKGCIKWAEEHNVKVITAKEMDIINDKRSKEKNK